VPVVIVDRARADAARLKIAAGGAVAAATGLTVVLRAGRAVPN